MQFSQASIVLFSTTWLNITKASSLLKELLELWQNCSLIWSERSLLLEPPNSTGTPSIGTVIVPPAALLPISERNLSEQNQLFAAAAAELLWLILNLLYAASNTSLHWSCAGENLLARTQVNVRLSRIDGLCIMIFLF